jgi:predicted Zn-ribbon and HTH transcriptional regulator
LTIKNDSLGAQRIKFLIKNKTNTPNQFYFFGTVHASQLIDKNLGVFMVQEARCVNCGFNIEKDYILFINGTEYTFDSFECAVNFVAPRCSHCNSIIMGHGIKHAGEIFCCQTCSKEESHSHVLP